LTTFDKYDFLKVSVSVLRRFASVIVTFYYNNGLMVRLLAYY
jgi:hypothetical protein